MALIRDYSKEVTKEFPRKVASDAFDFLINDEIFIKKIAIRCGLEKSLNTIRKVIDDYFHQLIWAAREGQVIQLPCNMGYFAVVKILGPYMYGRKVGCKYRIEWYLPEEYRNKFYWNASGILTTALEIKVIISNKDYQLKDEFEESYINT